MHPLRVRQLEEHLPARACERVAAGRKILADPGGDEMGILWQTDANANRHAVDAFERAAGQSRGLRARRCRYVVHDEPELDIDFILLELRRVRDAQEAGRGSSWQQGTRELAQLEDQPARRGE